MNSFEFPSWPVCDDKECDAAMRVLRSGKLNYWTGTEGREFEREFAEFVGSRHAIALANGTVGLELALAALEIGPGDEVIVPSRTFIATASSVVARGARPVCVDIDRDSQTMTPDTIRPHLTSRTKAIIPVHLAGWPCDMRPILELAKRLDLWVIEDCAQSHGSKYNDQYVGTLGHVGVFSFCQDKIMTTAGEGGMLVTNDKKLWKRAWSIKDHGKCFDAVNNQNHPPGFRWLHKSFGTNWRMTEVQSAIGREALRKLDSWVNLRRHHAQVYRNALGDCSAVRIPTPSPRDYHSFYKFYAFVVPERLRPGWSRDRLVSEISSQGIPCFTGSCSEIYLEDAFPAEWRPAERQPVARELGETSLMFLVHPGLTASCFQRIQSVLTTVMQAASKPESASRLRKTA